MTIRSIELLAEAPSFLQPASLESLQYPLGGHSNSDYKG